jgi:thiamine-monophosphate kinase
MSDTFVPSLVEAPGRAGPSTALGTNGAEDALVNRYRRPTPRLAEGEALAPHATAMMDVSDGLLLDAARMAAASGLALVIDLDRIPLSPPLRAFDPDPVAAATAGDDYELLFALSPAVTPPVSATRIGHFAPGSGLTLTRDGAPMPLPAHLGYLHG